MKPTLFVLISALAIGAGASAQRAAAPASAEASARQAPAAKAPAQKAPASKAPAGPSTLQTVVAAANAFVATLDEAQKAKTLFPFDSPQRTNWSNLPSGIYPRNSLKLGDITPAQRDAVMKMMAAVLSREGYQKVNEIIEADEVLKNRGGGRTGGRPGAPNTRTW